ncbi:unnamed protein product [Ostreobium quekettii]|uniref:Uncharacterized protein n=1 Tax=Ostreobium quekettii TaxID=121088 RepID=A0A8S1J486_9CHLO|nr:unnamed protein product [Ostreobium quekettii]|eukprot:evm.model.scf_1806.1 EVM.evm.TU.scf_1806.1   scf_1806:11276-17232(+)
MDALFHSDSAYVTVALFACGNAIAILAGLVLQWVWSVLSTFRDQFLWALLCSWALRDLKDGIVRRLDWSLRERSLPHFMLSLALLPFQAFGLGLTLTGASMPRCAREDSTGSTVGGVKSEWDSPQHTSSSSSQCLEPKSQRVDEGSSSSMLMGWLVRVTVAYSLMSWMREFWSWNWAGRTLPIGVILASIIVLVCLVYWVPICWKRAAWRLNPTTDVGASATHPTLKRSQVLQFVSGTLRQVTKGVHKVDAFVRSRLRLLLDGLVSIGLIACLLMGSVLLAAFVSVQIVHESKLAVAQVNQMVLRSSNKTDLEGVWSTVRVYQDSVLGMVQEFLPDVTQTIGSRVDSFLQAHNLTQVAVYAKLVYGLTVATPCEGDEMHNLAADVAAANAGLRALQEAQSQLMQQVESRQGEFLAAATRWEALKAGGQFRIFPGLHDYALSMAGNELVESRQRLMEANQKLADAHK